MSESCCQDIKRHSCYLMKIKSNNEIGYEQTLESTFEVNELESKYIILFVFVES